jgi:ornithine decarboxylase
MEEFKTSEFITDFSSLINEYNINVIDSNLDTYDIVNKYLEKNNGDESFLIVDIGEIIRQYNKWKNLLPRITPFYAIKCNPSPIIIKILNKLGCCFDTASKNEILKVIELGVSPKNIVFANPCKPVDFIKFARSNDVDLLVIDSTYELYKIKLYHPEANILLRIQTDDSKSRCKFNSKFGVVLDEVESILTMAKQLKINMKGVSFHVGSGCSDANVYHTAISDCKKVFEIAKKLDILMDLIDIGGGFPGVDDAKISFTDIAQVINDSIDEFFPSIGDSSDTDTNDITFIAEPGRYFVASSHTLVVSVINKKEYIDKETNIQKNIYYISDGVYSSFSGIIYDYAKFELLPFNERNEKTYPSIVYGSTCDSLDCITKDCNLPLLAIGESMIVKNIGAYSVASATEFNGFPLPTINYILT